MSKTVRALTLALLLLLGGTTAAHADVGVATGRPPGPCMAC